MSRIVIRPQAEAEISQAANWYEKQLPGLGVSFMQAIHTAVALIDERPSAFSPVGRGARRYVLRQFPYAIIYREHAETIVIYSCFHSSRNPKRWMDRLP